MRAFPAGIAGMALVLSGLMYWLYTQQVACDAKPGSCVVYLAGHPEDRLVNQSSPSDSVVIVGLDNQSVKTVGTFPVPRPAYAAALQNLENAGAAVVALDISFPDPREPNGDKAFAAALAKSKIPVVLAYAADNILPADGKYVQTSSSTDPTGIDQIPLRMFWCADTSDAGSGPCQQPYPNVLLASVDTKPDNDGVLRRIRRGTNLPHSIADSMS